MKKTGIGAMLLALLAAGVLTGGCESDRYYQQEAVEDAREFLLDECPDMPFAAQEYIKFNRPFFLTSHLRGSGRWSTWQICVTWMVPQEEYAYLVFGTGSPNAYGWSPIRVLRRKYDAKDSAYYKLIQETQETLLQKYYWRLRRSDLNSVRYTQPDLWETNFPLEFSGAADTPESLALLADNMQYTQYTMVWEMPETPENCLVAVGYARDPRLGGWQDAFSGIFTKAELKAHQCGTEPVRKAYQELSEDAQEDWQEVVAAPEKGIVSTQSAAPETTSEKTQETTPEKETKSAPEAAQP